LPRPQGQVDILRHLRRGREFVAEVMERRRVLLAAEGTGARPPADGRRRHGTAIHLVR